MVCRQVYRVENARNDRDLNVVQATTITAVTNVCPLLRSTSLSLTTTIPSLLAIRHVTDLCPSEHMFSGDISDGTHR